MGTRGLRGVAMLVLGGLYALLLGGIGAILTGAGHGSDMLLRVSFSPVTNIEFGEHSPLVVFAFAFWPAVAMMAVISPARLLFVAMLTSHYVGALLLRPWSELEWCYRRAPSLVLAWCGIYLAGQLCVWIVAWLPHKGRDPWDQPTDGAGRVGAQRCHESARENALSKPIYPRCGSSDISSDDGM